MINELIGFPAGENRRGFFIVSYDFSKRDFEPPLNFGSVGKSGGKIPEDNSSYCT